MVEQYTLAVTPAGRLRFEYNDGFDADDKAGADAWRRRVGKGFSESQGSGLFALAAAKPEVPPSPVFQYWRGFAAAYLHALCRSPSDPASGPGAVGLPHDSELSELLLSAPPMKGGEYLSFQVFNELWDLLDGWVRGEVAAGDDGLAGWLKRNAPLWHQVGRVCFHLAENKKDSDYPFAFLATYAPGLSGGGGVQYKPLGKALQEYAGDINRKELIKVLAPVYRASESAPFVKEMVDSGDIYHPLAWSPREAYRMLECVPVLEESGILVRLPDWWKKRPRPRVSVSIGENKKGNFGADGMLDFNIGLALGDERLSEEEWGRIMASGDGLVNIKGQWVEVDREKLRSALDHWKKVEEQAAGEGISFIEGMRLLAGAPAGLEASELPGKDDREWAHVTSGKWLSELLSRLRDPDSLEHGGVSRDFRGTLRPYQVQGQNWLTFLTDLGLGACLADDMGLGKTVQVLAVLLRIKERKAGTGNGTGEKPSLLVLPASLLANWKDEIRRFAPSLSVRFIHPSETAGAGAAGADLIITTYGMLLRQTGLLETDWRLVILDEAQAIKNPSTRQSRAVKHLKAEARIALTGTPIENRLSDLWSLFDFLCPGLLGSAARFKEFIKGLESRGHDGYAPLRNLVQPYILRRLKTDRSIISDLPEKTEMKAYCGLSKKQAALYSRSVNELREALAGLDGMKRRGLVLSYLMRFKQICNHPSQLLGDGAYEPNYSGKFDRLKEICEEIASRQEKVLVFTQFREMTGPIAAFLGDVFKREGLVLHGGTPVQKRKTLIDLFQQDEGPPFFVLSLKAGGTGLNLTAASHVLHFDRWWNPAVENQATDRAFRIGQKRNVVVHKFICRGTVEEKIDALIDEKRSLSDDILKTGAEGLLTEMSDRELLDIVTLDIDRAGL
jgi:non-specific serine/threonine protein kinase